MSEIWGEELLSLEGENTRDFERQNTIGKPTNSTTALEENDVMHENMMDWSWNLCLKLRANATSGVETSNMGNARVTV